MNAERRSPSSEQGRSVSRRRPMSSNAACLRSCSRPVPEAATRGPAVAARAAVLAVGIQCRQGGGAPARADRMEFAGPQRLSDRRRTDRTLPRAARNTHAAARGDPDVQPRHRDQPRRLRQGEDEGQGAGAVRNPLSERQGPGGAARRCRHRRIGHVVLASIPPAATVCPRSANASARDRIAYGMPDVRGAGRARYAGKTVAVLGAGHSAVGTLIDLVQLADEVPGTQARSGCCAAPNLQRPSAVAATTSWPRAASLAPPSRRSWPPARCRSRQASASRTSRTPKAVSGFRRVRPAAARSVVIADELIVATGFRPDLSFLSELRLRLDPAIEAPVALAPLIDPNEHSCGTVRPHGARELAHDEPGFYLAGMKSYGRAPTFLMVTGYEQVRSIAADIAGDKAAAARVELVLPETGVCTRGGVETGPLPAAAVVPRPKTSRPVAPPTKPPRRPALRGAAVHDAALPALGRQARLP